MILRIGCAERVFAHLGLIVFFVSEHFADAVDYFPLAETDPELSEQCFNGGQVVTSDLCSGSSVCCQCPDEFSGIGCSTRRCNSNGVFNSTTNLCECFDLRGGDECNSVTQCFNGGTLSEGSCICPADWMNDFCDTPICRNGTLVSRSSCMCDLGYHGQFCEIPLICVHGKLSQSMNACVCEDNFAKPTCEFCIEGFQKISVKVGDQVNTTCEERNASITSAGADRTGLWVVLGLFLSFLVLGILVFIIWKCCQRYKKRKENKINPYAKNPPTIESPSSFDAEVQTSRPTTVKQDNDVKDKANGKNSLGSNNSFDQKNRNNKGNDKYSPRVEKKSPRVHGPRPDWIP